MSGKGGEDEGETGKGTANRRFSLVTMEGGVLGGGGAGGGEGCGGLGGGVFKIGKKTRGREWPAETSCS